MNAVSRLLGIVVAVALVVPGVAAAAPELERVGDFSAPMFVTAPPGDYSRLFVVERAGLVRIVADGTTLPDPFLDVSSDVSTNGERGLLSIAFAPDYDRSGLVYVYLTAARPAGEMQLREYHVAAGDPNRVEPTSERIVWRHPHPVDAIHNGSTIRFGPDGMLWIATGDGGGAYNGAVPNSAQLLSSQLGKLLRLDPRPDPFAIPATNPFVGVSGAAPTVVASGLRNPFRWSFDSLTGDLVLGDVGQDAREEVDFLPRARLLSGVDFGWRCREGSIVTPGQSCTPRSPYVPPIFDYAHPSAPGTPRAVVAGTVVRDPGLPGLVGRILYADTYIGDVRSLDPSVPGADDRSLALPRVPMIVDFGEDASGRLYVVSLTGPVYRLKDGTVTPSPGGGAVPPPPVVDATRVSPLRLRIAIARRQLAVRLGLRLRVSCTVRCRLGAAASIPGIARFRGDSRSLAAGRTAHLRLRLSASGATRARRALRRHGLVARVELLARDGAGNTMRATRRVRLRR